MKNLMMFCPKCCLRGSWETCPDCQVPMKQDKLYKIPVFIFEKDAIDYRFVDEAQIMFSRGWACPVPNSTTTFNVKTNGEWNGVDIGKKIKEKNEQLKKKVSGYSYEERNVRADVEKQLIKKQQQEKSQ